MPIDVLTTKFVLDAEQYVLGSKRATAATLAFTKAQGGVTTSAQRHKQAMTAASAANAKDAGTIDILIRKYGSLNRAMNAASASSKGGGGGMGALGGLVSGARALGGAAGVVGGVVTALAAIPAAAIAGEKALFDLAQGPAMADAEWGALVSALTAVEGSSKAAKAELKDLLAIAKGPGLGQVETIQGYNQLRNSGLSESLSERLIREFGNANAKAGGGPEKLGNILAQVSQAASKPFLQGDELSTLTENGIPAYKIVKDALGTSDTEELKKKGVTSVQVLEAIATALEKTERVGGSTKNSFDNLFDTLAAANREVGSGVNESWGPLADKIEGAVAAASKAGVFQDLGRTITEALNLDNLDVDEALVNVLAFAKTGIQFFGRLKDMIFAALGPLGKFLGFVLDHGSVLGPGKQSFEEMLDINRNDIRESMKKGRKLTENEAKRTASAAADAKAYRLPDGTIDVRAREAAAKGGKVPGTPAPAAPAPVKTIYAADGKTVDVRAMEEAQRKAVEEANKKALADVPLSEQLGKGKDKDGRVLSALEKTAEGVGRLVVAQERALSLDQAAAGGGSWFAAGLAPVNLGRATGASNARGLLEDSLNGIRVAFINNETMMENAMRRVNDRNRQGRR